MVIELDPLAREASRRFRARIPEYDDRYGTAGAAWCVHDAKYKLAWAAWSAEGTHDIAREIHWLLVVLESRGFPLEWLLISLRIAIDVVRERLPTPIAEAMINQLRIAEQVVQSHRQLPTVLSPATGGPGDTWET